MTRLRQKPCGPLLAAMVRRLNRFDSRRLEQRIVNGRLLTSLLRGHVVCPGAEIEPHNYWLFPAIVADPKKSIAALEAAGFDATQAQSMRAIEAPGDRPKLDPENTKNALERMILIPCWAGIPEAELRRMAEVLIRVESETTRIESLKVTLQPTDTAYGDRNAETAEECADVNR